MSKPDKDIPLRTCPGQQIGDDLTRELVAPAKTNGTTKDQPNFCRSSAESENSYEGQRAVLGSPCEIAGRQPEWAIRFVPERILVDRALGAAQHVVPEPQILLADFKPRLRRDHDARRLNLDVRDRGNNTHVNSSKQTGRRGEDSLEALGRFISLPSEPSNYHTAPRETSAKSGREKRIWRLELHLRPSFIRQEWP